MWPFILLIEEVLTGKIYYFNSSILVKFTTSITYVDIFYKCSRFSNVYNCEIQKSQNNTIESNKIMTTTIVMIFRCLSNWQDFKSNNAAISSTKY